MLNDQEGVIKYRLDHQHLALAAEINIAEINAWRSIFYRLGLIGQVPEKYAGLGYGNISQRLVPDDLAFLISGTQTGNLASLSKQHFALIKTASPQHNAIQSIGLSQPSSEALTHASVYQQNQAICAVIHVHCPEIWHQTAQLGLAFTSAQVAYGTPEMANAVGHLFDSGRLQTCGLFSMLGHEDGIVAFGANLASAAELLIGQLANALSIEQKPSGL